MKNRLTIMLIVAAAMSVAACAQQSPSSRPVTPALPAAPATVVEQPSTLTTPTGDIFGTLELPAAAFPVPVALIIAGSGPTNRNGNSEMLPPGGDNLKMLADGLAARGIASLRYDKRGIAASAAALKSEADIRFNHYVDDASAWIGKLRADPRFSTITVVGHSEGSLIGMVAAREARADGFVSLEGAGRKPQEVIVEQLSAQLPPAIVTQAADALRKIEAGEKPDTVPPMLMGLFRPSVQPYLISWFKYSPTDEIAKLTIPTMIVQGTTDLQVNEKDSKALAAARPAAKLVVIEGMNHVLKAAQGARAEQMITYADPKVPVMPRLIDEVAGFIKSVPRHR